MSNSWIIRFAVVLFMTAATAVSSAAAGKCQLLIVAKLPMTVLRSGRVSVPMNVGGKTFNMLVDTGGLLSMLSPEAVESLGLAPLSLPATTEVYQYGGLKIDSYVIVRDVSLGRLSAGEFRFLVMPRGGYFPDEEGLLAPDILGSFDAEFDFANATLNLFQSNDCRQAPIYWTHDRYAEVDILLGATRQIHVPVTIDGKRFKAVFDTGASDTVARLEKIEDTFGIDEKSLKLIDRATPERPRYRYPFKAVSFEGVTVNNPDIVLVPDSQSKLYNVPDIIIGMNVLRQLHLYVAYEKRELYLTSASAH